MTLETDCAPSVGTAEMPGKHFILGTVLFQFDSTKIIKLVVHWSRALNYMEIYHSTRNSDREIWHIIQYTYLPTDFRI